MKALPYLLLLALLIPHSSHAQFKWLKMFEKKDYSQDWRDYGRRLAENDAALKAEREKTNQVSLMFDKPLRDSLELQYKYRRKEEVKAELDKTVRMYQVALSKMEDNEVECERCTHRHRESRDMDDFPTYTPTPQRRSSYFDEQRDNSGLYYQRTIVGDNAGDWSIQFINGP